MYEIIRNIINYTGSSNFNIESYILNTCMVVIPMMIAFFMWQFTKLISYVINPKKG